MRKLFWSQVWARLIAHRISNETWQAAFTIPEGFENNRCFNKPWMSQLTFKTTDDAAYDTFVTDFAKLRPDWQIALSGATLNAWHEKERDRR